MADAHITDRNKAGKKETETHCRHGKFGPYARCIRSRTFGNLELTILFIVTNLVVLSFKIITIGSSPAAIWWGEDYS